MASWGGFTCSIAGSCPEGGTTVEIRDYARLVRRMRDGQRQYFRTRTQADLVASKDLERQVDSATRHVLDTRPRESLPLLDGPDDGESAP
jgi:hypothetical protein